jgi:hypothetical protein
VITQEDRLNGLAIAPLVSVSTTMQDTFIGWTVNMIIIMLAYLSWIRYMTATENLTENLCSMLKAE